MSEILLIRHAPTDWNKDKRLQGLSDVPLSEESRAWIKTWKIPERFKDFSWQSSPLIRALETAECLYSNPVPANKFLVEMDFGDWEGEALPALRSRLGAQMQENEDLGLDFLPPNGESPRMVQKRLKPLFDDILKAGNSVLVSHHGVMRAIMALAYDWPMVGKPPVKFKQGRGYLFEISKNLKIIPLEMHIPLAPDDGQL